MYEVHCSQFFGSLETDEFRVDSPVDNFAQCRNVRTIMTIIHTLYVGYHPSFLISDWFLGSS